MLIGKLGPEQSQDSGDISHTGKFKMYPFDLEL